MIGKHTRVTFARLAPSSRIFKHNVKDGNFKNTLKTNIKDGDDVPQRLIIPIVSGPPDSPGHFFRACFDFSVDDPEFFANV
jgi:hypothetical protein